MGKKNLHQKKKIKTQKITAGTVVRVTPKRRHKKKKKRKKKKKNITHTVERTLCGRIRSERILRSVGGGNHGEAYN